MKALDLFCGGGGAALGLRQAGFDEIVGIDIKPRPNYPFDFIQADVLALPVDVMDFDFIWASPPCQAFSTGAHLRYGKGKRNPNVNLIPITREILNGHPFTVIENVRHAPIRPDVVLTGPSVGLLYILRRRHFEMSWFMFYPPPVNGLPKERWKSGKALCVTKQMRAKIHYYARKAIGLPGMPTREHAKEVMGIPLDHQMTYAEIGEAVPPPYSKFIAENAIQQLNN